MLTHDQKVAIEDLIKRVGDDCIHGYFRNLSEGDISYKESEYDPVSVADREAEKLLQEGMQKILPGSLFIGEEIYAEDSNILEHLNQSEKPVWIVDPIDGTQNFVTGKEGFGILACLVNNGSIVSSWFYEVCSKELITYHNGNGISINNISHLVPVPSEEPYLGQLSYRLYEFPEVNQIKEKANTLQIDQAIDPSIINYTKMLKGELDFLVYKITYPWDHLAGISMVRDSGGFAVRWDANDFQLPDTHAGLVVARNQEVLDNVLNEIIKPLMQSKDIMTMTVYKRGA